MKTPEITPANNPSRTFFIPNDTHSVIKTGRSDIKFGSGNSDKIQEFSDSAPSIALITSSSYGFVLVLKSVINSPSLPIKYL